MEANISSFVICLGMSSPIFFFIASTAAVALINYETTSLERVGEALEKLGAGEGNVDIPNEPFGYDIKRMWASINEIEKNLKKANLNTLIRSLAALYILNIYFSNERYFLDKDTHAAKLDKSAGSLIFTFSVAPSPDNTLYTSEEGIIPETCIYKITRKESEYAFKITYRNLYNETKSMHRFQARDKYQEELKSYLGTVIDEKFFWDFQAKYFNGNAVLLREEFVRNNKLKDIISVQIEQMRAVFWAELNI